jgi:lysophospholipase L1-like esterase
MKTKFFLFAAFFAVASISFAQEKTVKVACVGNSITYGSGLKDRHKDSYPMVLGRMLGEGYEVENFGLGGRTLLRKGDRPYIFENRFRAALAFQPNVVVIKLGTNDSKPINRAYIKEDFVADMTALVDSFRSLPSNPKIFLCYPARVYNSGLGGISDSIITADIIPNVKKTAEELKLQLIDLQVVTSEMSQNFPDNVHPNELGAIAIAEAVYQAIVGKTKKYVAAAEKCECEAE